MREVAGSPPDTRRTGGTISICQSAQTGSPRRSHDACAYRWNLCTPGNIRHPAARVPLTDPACFIIPRLPAGGVYFRRRSPAEKIATRPAQETKIYRRLGPLLLATMWSHIYIFPVCFFFFFSSPSDSSILQTGKWKFESIRPWPARKLQFYRRFILVVLVLFFLQFSSFEKRWKTED